MTDRKSVHLCGRDVSHAGHICAFFDSREEQYDTLSPYYLEGIEQGEQVVTIVDSGRLGDHADRMKAHGIPVEEAASDGRLKVYTSEDTYTAGGSFAAQRMYDLLQCALAEAKSAGKTVRASGVMDWAYRGHAGSEELMEYEAKVNVLVPIYDCTLLCVYDLSQIDARRMMDILTTHPYVIHQRQVVENPYYRPSIDLLQDLLRRETPKDARA